MLKELLKENVILSNRLCIMLSVVWKGRRLPVKHCLREYPIVVQRSDKLFYLWEVFIFPWDKGGEIRSACGFYTSLISLY